MSFPDNLRQIRIEKRLTQEKLAEMLDISRQSIAKWEQGDGFPETQRLLTLAKELGISLDWLFEDELINEEKVNNQPPIPQGIIAGLEAFSSALSQCMSETNTRD